MGVKHSVNQDVETVVSHMGCSPASFLCPWISQEEYWSVLPFPSPGNLPDPGIKLGSPTLQVGSLLYKPPGKPKVLFK